MCWSSWYWWAERAKHTLHPLEDSCFRPGTCRTTAPWRYSKAWNKNWAGDRAAESSCRESGATELPRAPGQPCQLLKSGKALGKEPSQEVNSWSVWKLWHWLMQWWCLVLQLFRMSPFIHEGRGSRSPPPGTWAALRLAGQSQERVSLWEGGAAGWNSHIVHGQRMYPFCTAMQLILFANKGTLDVFHDTLWAYFYVKELNV